MDETISIIIPVFNGSAFIENAYAQIIKQEITDLELIFVDNNSTDNSISLIETLREKDPRIVLEQEQKQGAAAARNKGISIAKGVYIYFFDVDDDLFEGALLSLKQVLDANVTVESAFGNGIKSRERLETLQRMKEGTQELTIYEKGVLGVRWMDYGTLPGTPSFLFRRTVFSKIGHFNTQLKLGEDAAFLVKLGMECRVAHLDRNIMLYYRHPESTVSKQNQVQPYKEFTYWQPLIHEHIPYYLSHKVPKDFKKKVLLKTYGYIAKMLARTKGYNQRKKLKRRLFHDIQPITLPLMLKPFVWLISLTGSLNIYKVYFFYVLKPYLNYCTR